MKLLTRSRAGQTEQKPTMSGTGDVSRFLAMYLCLVVVTDLRERDSVLLCLAIVSDINCFCLLSADLHITDQRVAGGD